MGWYLWLVPDAQRALLHLGVATIGPGAFTAITRSALMVLVSSASILAVVYFLAWKSPQDFSLRQALGVLFLGLIATASGEYSREALRKPFVVGRHMYSNGIRVSAVEDFNKNGYLTKSIWTEQSTNLSPKLMQGRAMFRGQCISCHTIDGYRSLKRLVAGRDRDGIDNMLKLLHEYKPDSPYHAYMPPLVGKPDEIAALGDYIATLNAPKTSALASEKPASKEALVK